MRSEIVIKIKNTQNKRLFHLFIKTTFGIEQDCDIQYQDGYFSFMVNYKIGKPKCEEKLKPIKDDFEVVNIRWDVLTREEEEELTILQAALTKQ